MTAELFASDRGIIFWPTAFWHRFMSGDKVYISWGTHELYVETIGM